MRLRPRALPKVRDQVVKHLTDPAMPVRAHTGADNQAGLDLAANHLRAAELYWVAPDMATLAVSAGAQLAAARWATADRPSGCGLMVWDGGIGQIDAQGVAIPVDACTWGPAPGGCMVGLWVSRHRVANVVVVDQVPPLIPIISYTLPVTAEPVSMADLGEGVPVTVFAALAASWLLLQQPKLVERTRELPDKPVRRAYGRAGREEPHVTVVDLRRQYVPDREDEDAGGRRYRHRWVVSGHWRMQAVGPEWSERRRIWVPSHVKGPDGAPLLVTERVNVWRR